MFLAVYRTHFFRFRGLSPKAGMRLMKCFSFRLKRYLLADVRVQVGCGLPRVGAVHDDSINQLLAELKVCLFDVVQIFPYIQYTSYRLQNR